MRRKYILGILVLVSVFVLVSCSKSSINLVRDDNEKKNDTTNDNIDNTDNNESNIEDFMNDYTDNLDSSDSWSPSMKSIVDPKSIDKGEVIKKAPATKDKTLDSSAEENCAKVKYKTFKFNGIQYDIKRIYVTDHIPTYLNVPKCVTESANELAVHMDCKVCADGTYPDCKVCLVEYTATNLRNTQYEELMNTLKVFKYDREQIRMDGWPGEALYLSPSIYNMNDHRCMHYIFEPNESVNFTELFFLTGDYNGDYYKGIEINFNDMAFGIRGRDDSPHYIELQEGIEVEYDNKYIKQDNTGDNDE